MNNLHSYNLLKTVCLTWETTIVLLACNITRGKKPWRNNRAVAKMVAETWRHGVTKRRSNSIYHGFIMFETCYKECRRNS